MPSSPAPGWDWRGESAPPPRARRGTDERRYVLFSIGNLTPLFSAVWPACWKKFTVCNEIWTESVTYLEICGIIVGQILVGYLGDR